MREAATTKRGRAAETFASAAVHRRIPFPSWGTEAPYLSSTVAPASSSFFFISSASALETCFLDGLGRALDQVLRLFEAQAGDLADALMTWILFAPAAARIDVELRLLLDRGRGGRGSRRPPPRRRPAPPYAPLVLERLDELGDLDDRQVGKVIDDLLPVISAMARLLRTSPRRRRIREACVKQNSRAQCPFCTGVGHFALRTRTGRLDRRPVSAGVSPRGRPPSSPCPLWP